MNLSQKQTRPLLDRVAEWNIYHRLLELGIPCRGDPFTIGEVSASQAVQVWCVTKAVIASRQEQINFLKQCWRLNHGHEQVK